MILSTNMNTKMNETEINGHNEYKNCCNDTILYSFLFHYKYFQLFHFLNLSIFNSNPHPFYISEYEFFEKIKALKTKVELSDRKNN